MNKFNLRKSIIGAIAALAFLFAFSTHASITPVLSVVPTGDGNSVQLNVNGDPSVSVLLYSNINLVAVLGNTNSNGTFSTVVSSSTYGITSNSPVHVVTNGINGLSSATVSWPTVSASVGGQLTLSQTGLVLSIGQSSSISAVSNVSGSLYVSNNSNPAVANVNVSGNTISVVANSYGSTTVTICATGNLTNCPSIYVTVQNNGATPLTFSQNSITLAYGQSVPITINGGNGMYTVVNNSNSGLVSSVISGNTVTLSTQSSSGSTSVTVCSTDMVSCGIINITLGTVSSTPVSFGQTNPVVSVGQSLTVSLYGGTGNSYYVSSNSNPNIVQANISGNTLNLYGLTNGSTSISVCSSVGGCNSLSVTVNYVSSGGIITLSQSSINILTNQTLSIAISGGTAPYNLPATSSSLFQANVNGNVLNITGLSAGSQQVAVCSASGGCTWLSLQVNGASTATTSGTPTLITFSQSSVNLSIGQNVDITVYGGSSYYIPFNSNSSALNASLSGSTLLLSGLSNSASVVIVCSSTTSCGAIPVLVGSVISSSSSLPSGCTTSSGFSTITGQSCGNESVPVTPVANTTTAASSPSYVFTSFLTIGSQGDEVTQLQNKLTSLGYYTGPITGYFGSLTAAAVSSLQRAHGISPVGYVGPSTRDILN